MMPWHYREDRATQAAARLLNLRGGNMSYMKLIKLLYFADRKALAELGRPITFDHYVSMPHGPVLSRTYDLISAEPDPGVESYWRQYVSQRDTSYDVHLLRDEVPNDQLSSAEEAILDGIFAEWGRKSRYQVRDHSHTLPEWTDPHGSSYPINVRDVLLAQGRTQEDAEEIEAALAAESALHALVA